MGHLKIISILFTLPDPYPFDIFHHFLDASASQLVQNSQTDRWTEWQSDKATLSSGQFCIALCDVLWLFMTVHDFAWLCMTVHYYVWLFIFMKDYVWLKYDYVWLYVTIYEYVWLYMTNYDYVWICMTMFDYVWL